MKKSEDLLHALSIPTGDRHNLPVSSMRFPHGAHERVEIRSVEGPAALTAVLDEERLRGVTVHRVSQGSGMILLTDGEIKEMAAIGQESGIEVCLFVGPRAPWEATAQALTPDGKLLGWRQTGMDQLRYALDDVFRGAELGIRSVLVADERLLWLIDQARRRRSTRTEAWQYSESCGANATEDWRPERHYQQRVLGGALQHGSLGARGGRRRYGWLRA